MRTILQPGRVLLRLLLLTGSCAASFRNYQGQKPDSEVSILQQRGYRFRLYDQKRSLVDSLRLTPGDYMLEFRATSSGEVGVARCELAKGTKYGFELGQRRYMPDLGATYLIGKCKKL